MRNRINALKQNTIFYDFAFVDQGQSEFITGQIKVDSSYQNKVMLKILKFK